MKRVRGFDESSIVVSVRNDKIKVEIYVRGGKTFCNINLDKAKELGELLIKASDEANKISEENSNENKNEKI